MSFGKQDGLISPYPRPTTPRLYGPFGKMSSAFDVMPSLAPKTAMGYMRFHLPKQLPLFLAMFVSSAFSVIAQRDSAGTEEQARRIFPRFLESSSALGINFRNMASHTSKKYLIETMAPGVAYLTTTTTGVWIFSSSTGRRSPTRRPRELSRRSRVPSTGIAFITRSKTARLKT